MSSERTSFGRGQTNIVLHYEDGGHIKSTEINMQASLTNEISKSEAIAEFGEAVVDKAIEMYETDFGKTFFEEDTHEGTDAICGERLEYLYKAEFFLTTNKKG